MNDWHDLGHGHRYTFFENGSGERLGIIEEHDSDRPDNCRSSIYFGGTTWAETLKKAGSSAVIWAVQSMEPLTLSPSLACMMCPSHGFIRDGQWVPA